MIKYNIKKKQCYISFEAVNEVEYTEYYKCNKFYSYCSKCLGFNKYTQIGRNINRITKGNM